MLYNLYPKLSSAKHLVILCKFKRMCCSKWWGGFWVVDDALLLQPLTTYERGSSCCMISIYKKGACEIGIPIWIRYFWENFFATFIFVSFSLFLKLVFLQFASSCCYEMCKFNYAVNYAVKYSCVFKVVQLIKPLWIYDSQFLN